MTSIILYFDLEELLRRYRERRLQTYIRVLQGKQRDWPGEDLAMLIQELRRILAKGLSHEEFLEVRKKVAEVLGVDPDKLEVDEDD